MHFTPNSRFLQIRRPTRALFKRFSLVFPPTFLQISKNIFFFRNEFFPRPKPFVRVSNKTPACFFLFPAEIRQNCKQTENRPGSRRFFGDFSFPKNGAARFVVQKSKKIRPKPYLIGSVNRKISKSKPFHPAPHRRPVRRSRKSLRQPLLLQCCELRVFFQDLLSYMLPSSASC